MEYKKERPNTFIRRPEGKDLIFGIRAVEETLRSGKQVDRLLIQKDHTSPAINGIISLAQQAGIAIQRVPVDRLDRITRKLHQGVICFISPIHYVPLHNVISGIFEKGETPLLVILDRVTDVRNFGAIARSAECAGVHAIIVPEKGSAQIGDDAMKTSAGALNYLSICKENNLINTIQFLQESGIHVIACTEKAEQLIYNLDFTIPVAILMGSEEDGISLPLLRRADSLAALPMNGQINSLNVSVATALVVYEAIRQRLG
jgi:23S rRNA (guanosine2251-2'-O)-methyltransferase